MVFEFLVHLIDMILLDVVGMGIREIEESLAEMAHDRVLVKELLIVEALGNHFLLRRSPSNRGLIGEGKLLLFNPITGLFEHSRLAALLHVKEQHAGIDEVRIAKEFAVMVSCRGLLITFNIDIPKKMNIFVEHDVGVKIKHLIRNHLHLIGEEADQCIR